MYMYIYYMYAYNVCVYIYIHRYVYTQTCGSMYIDVYKYYVGKRPYLVTSLGGVTVSADLRDSPRSFRKRLRREIDGQR